MKPFLSIREASEYLGLEYKSVYRLVRAGEIPAARLGGVYRIKLSDLEGYFEQQKQHVHATSDEKANSVSPQPTVHCGRCLRVVRNPSKTGGACQTDECDEVLCQACWDDEEFRFCNAHEPSIEERLKQARKDLAAGRISRLTTAEQARQFEVAYIGRFDRKVRELTMVREPSRAKEIVVRDWSAIHKTANESNEFGQYAATGSSISNPKHLPQNPYSSYQVAESNRNQSGLVIAAQCCAPLKTFVRYGIAINQLGMDEILNRLQVTIQRAEETNTVHVIAFASAVGWTAEAVEYVGGSQSATVFHHRLVMPFLVDLFMRALHRNRLDARLTDYDLLFSPKLRQELVDDAKRYATDYVLATRRSLSAGDASRALDLPLELTTQAFEGLKKDLRFTIVTLPDVGLVIGSRD